MIDEGLSPDERTVFGLVAALLRGVCVGQGWRCIRSHAHPVLARHTDNRMAEANLAFAQACTAGPLSYCFLNSTPRMLVCAWWCLLACTRQETR